MGFWSKLLDGIRHKQELKYAYKTEKAKDKFDYKKDAVEHGIDPGLGGVLSKGLDLLGNKTPGLPGSEDAAKFNFMKNLPLLLGGGLFFAVLLFFMKPSKSKKR